VTFVELDPTATSMAGWNGQANLNRNSGNVTVNLGVWGMSPGLEVNDAGYSTQTDRAGAHALAQYRKLTPDRGPASRTFLGVEVVDVELGQPVPGRRLAGLGERTIQEHVAVVGPADLREARVGRQLTRGGPT